MQKHVVAIDDDPRALALIEDIGQMAGVAVSTATESEAFLAECRERQPCLAVIDLNLGATDGIQVIEELRNRHIDASVLLVSGFDSRVLSTAERLVDRMGLRCLGGFKKPLDIDRLADTIRAEAREAVTLGPDDVRAAIADDRIVPYYQPKARYHEGEGWHIFGVEALARLLPKSGGAVVGAGRFIPVAENAGMIDDINEIIFRKAIAQTECWDAEGIQLHPSINVTSSSAQDRDMPDRLAEIASKSSIDTQWITLELTETSLSGQGVESLDVLSRLRLRGFGLAIDDFGTGFSSLARLVEMPFSELKVDMSFTMGASHSNDNAAVCRAVGALGHSLGIEVCYEGVETARTLELVKEWGGRIAQGAYFGMPMPASELVGRIDSMKKARAV